jgi:RNA polymerase sigma-70 factor (ECF subfamily)
LVEFDALYERFRRPVWRLARRLTENDEEALETTQEIFLRVWRGLEGFRGDSKISTWVFQIAWNYLRAYRRKRGRQLQFVSAGSERAQETVEIAADPAADPERRTAANESVARLDAALRSLPEHHRVVVWLRDGEELSYQEISQVLDVPIGTVRSRLARARAALRDVMEL